MLSTSAANSAFDPVRRLRPGPREVDPRSRALQTAIRELRFPGRLWNRCEPRQAGSKPERKSAGAGDVRREGKVMVVGGSQFTRRGLLIRAAAGVFGAALTTTVGSCSTVPAASGRPTPGSLPAGPTAESPLTSSATSNATITVATPGTGVAPVPTIETPRRGGALRFANS